MRLLTTVVALTVLGATPAMAQDVKPFEGASVTAIAGVDARTLNDTDTKFIFGGQVGYDWQSKSLVYGVEAEVTGRSTSGCVTYAPSYRGCDKGGRDFYIGARAGVAVSDMTLLYGKAGYTNRRDSYSYQTTTNGPVTIGRYTTDGFRLGAGIEQRVGSTVSLKAEYRISHANGYFNRHHAVAGLGFRF
jgi:outer membrane immunogenic protein